MSTWSKYLRELTKEYGTLLEAEFLNTLWSSTWWLDKWNGEASSLSGKKVYKTPCLHTTKLFDFDVTLQCPLLNIQL